MVSQSKGKRIYTAEVISMAYLCDQRYGYQCDQKYGYLCDQKYGYQCDQKYGYQCDQEYGYECDRVVGSVLGLESRFSPWGGQGGLPGSRLGPGQSSPLPRQGFALGNPRANLKGEGDN